MGNRTQSNIEAKKSMVNNLSSEIKEYGSILIFEYAGLNASEVFSMKKKLKSSDSKMVVCTNNIINRAIKELKINNENRITGPNAVLLTRNDIKPFKEIINLSKDKEFIKLKLAYFEGETLENEKLSLLSSLGSKEDLLITFSQRMMTPLYKLLYLLKNISGGKL